MGLSGLFASGLASDLVQCVPDNVSDDRPAQRSPDTRVQHNSCFSLVGECTSSADITVRLMVERHETTVPGADVQIRWGCGTT